MMTKTLSFLAMLTVAVAGGILLTSNMGTQAFDAEGEVSIQDSAEKAAYKAEKDAYKAQLEAAVVANDFDAFKTQGEAMRAEKEAKMEEKLGEKFASFKEKMADKVAPTEEELQEKFDAMVTYYNENGELPTRKGKRGHGKRGGGCDK